MAVESKLIVGNWKMNLTTHEASLYLHKLSGLVKPHRDVTAVIAPTLLAVQSLSLQIDRHQFKLAAQNLYWQDHGAFTGEVSASQLKGVVDYAIIGHSDRRHKFGETDKEVRNKMQAAVRNHIKPILCIGETASERTDGETLDVIHDQLLGGLANITSEELEQIAVAYEPVWALGTGNSALPDDVRVAVKAIRSQIKHLYGAAAADNLRILYGGSVTPSSAADYLAIEGISGLLVGGASLDPQAFSEIVNQAHKGSAVVKK